MADLPSTFAKVNDVEVTQDAPVTEALEAKFGSNDNYLKDNLDAEITNRAAGDAAITADINTNVKGAGPTQTLTQLKARVENAKNVVRILSDTNHVDGTTNPTTVFLDATDTDTYKLKSIVQTGVSAFLVTTLYDTTYSVASNRIPVLTVGSNGVNVFYRIQIWEISSV